MTSACRAANTRPVSDDPAWKITGWPCAERAAPIGTADVEVLAVVVWHVNPVDVVEDACGAVLDDGVAVPRVPQFLDDVDRFVCDAVPLVVVDDARALKLSAAARAKLVTRFQPARPPLRWSSESSCRAR